jgi:hypothetical protein
MRINSKSGAPARARVPYGCCTGAVRALQAMLEWRAPSLQFDRNEAAARLCDCRIARQFDSPVSVSMGLQITCMRLAVAPVQIAAEGCLTSWQARLPCLHYLACLTPDRCGTFIDSFAAIVNSRRYGNAQMAQATQHYTIDLQHAIDESRRLYARHFGVKSIPAECKRLEGSLLLLLQTLRQFQASLEDQGNEPLVQQLYTDLSVGLVNTLMELDEGLSMCLESESTLPKDDATTSKKMTWLHDMHDRLQYFVFSIEILSGLIQR